MKKCLLLFILFFGLNFNTNAQTYVTIPDANFVMFLQQEYPSCMSGNQLDIDCEGIHSVENVIIYSSSISDLTGIEYFSNLRYLDCSNNLLTSLPILSNSTQILYCYSNQLASLPDLPNGLKALHCFNNQLTSLPVLSDSLELLICSMNNIASLPTLPSNLKILNCSDNQISNIPIFPNTLIQLACSNNLLDNIPQLPDSLELLECGYNQISILPFFPNTLKYLECNNNFLTELPLLPDSLQRINCSNNMISCFSVFNDNYSDFNISNNPFTCLPNYITAMMFSTYLEIPLCLENDIFNNYNECVGLTIGVLGKIYNDTNSNCFFENIENTFSNFAIKLYNTGDSLINITNCFSNGVYHFPIDSGSYILKLDTLNMPFTLQCQSLDTSVILTSQNPLADSVNFALVCKPGFDIGTQSVLTNGWVFPGQNHEVKILTGDMSQWYNMACASGVSGEIQVSLSGPVTVQNSNGALTPSVSGNSFTYSISDFGSVDFLNAFVLVFKTDTTAQAGDEICVSVDVTPNSGDNNMSNNHYEFCYSVVNSYDPNMKEVYPVNVEPGFEDYFTYTIHFQNTGSAPAFNIRLLDTLDANLDLETFQVINYSHYNTTMVRNNVLTFNFPNIMLADSTSDLEGSKGYVQYRIKPKANLPLGTEIKNTANIYFDFNAPIVTNTTINKYVEENAIHEVEKEFVKVYPNSFNNQATIEFSKAIMHSEIKVYNIFGQEVYMASKINGNKLILDRGNHPSGIYFVKVTSTKMESQTLKLIVKD